MLVEDAQICNRLKKIVASLAAEPSLQDDLVQEGLFRLWQVECEHPGKTRSWYLQNCRFCILHRLASGRSIDSLKRSTLDKRVSLDETDSEGDPMEIPAASDVVEAVSFNDLQAVLSRQLTRREREVLRGLADGLRLNEIASQAKISYPTALKYRRRIAELVSRLELRSWVSQPTPSRDCVPRGNNQSVAAAEPRKMAA